MPVGPPPCKREGSGGGKSRARRPAAMQGAWRPYVRHRRCAGVAVSAAVVAAAAKRPRSVATGIARSKRTASLICRWVPEGSLAGFVDRRRSPVAGPESFGLVVCDFAGTVLDIWGLVRISCRFGASIAFFTLTACTFSKTWVFDVFCELSHSS